MIEWDMIARWINRITLVLGLLAANSAFVVAAAPQPLVFRGEALFDPIVRNFQPDRTIVIDGARIRSVSGPNAAMPPDARTVNCRGSSTFRA